MNAETPPLQRTQTHPGTGRGIPVISPTRIDSFQEVLGLWKEHDMLVFLADIPSSHCNYAENLDPRESFQKNHYITQYASLRYSVSRTLAKLLLAPILEIESPVDITLEKEHNGSIRVAGENSVHLCISYAQNFLALAIAHSKVGIDIELIRPVTICHIPGLAGTIMGEEPANAQDGVAFLQNWTAMEAYAKYSNTPLWKVLQNPQARKDGYCRNFIIGDSVIMSMVTATPCTPERMRCVVKE